MWATLTSQSQWNAHISLSLSLFLPFNQTFFFQSRLLDDSLSLSLISIVILASGNLITSRIQRSLSKLLLFFL